MNGGCVLSLPSSLVCPLFVGYLGPPAQFIPDVVYMDRSDALNAGYKYEARVSVSLVTGYIQDTHLT